MPSSNRVSWRIPRTFFVENSSRLERLQSSISESIHAPEGGRASMEGTRRVVIIGGGLAGLAAAVGLAKAGIAATILESRPRLGGRATSIVDPPTGELIDNCQHVAMGCCTNFFHFCKLSGIEHDFVKESLLTFIDSRNRQTRLSANPLLPAPFHLAGAFLRGSFLSWSEKIQLVAALRRLTSSTLSMNSVSLKNNRTYNTIQDFLTETRQSSPLIKAFWEPILVSALSESLDRIDFQAARQVFVDGFLSHSQAWNLWLPQAPLGEIYGQHLQNWLTSQQVSIRLQTGVEQVSLTENNTARITLRHGDVIEDCQVIVAVPWNLIGQICSPELLTCLAPGAAQLQSAPISSVHLWYDRPLTSLRHAVLIGRVSQWLFNRHLIQKASRSESFSYQVVISQSREVTDRPQAELITLVSQELLSTFPQTPEPKLLRARVITEHKAVFSPLPGSNQFRPFQETLHKDIVLAGDWTQTGWPATMEGAVISGYRAAEEILRQRGINMKFEQPPLGR